jgi:DNA-binding winged helix-turn-helix (wHTH) protein
MKAPAMSDDAPRRVRFGVFDLDVLTGELRKKGTKVHLQEQPFRVLAMLIARAGDLVMREELRQRLWPDAVYVDFDLGLNKAVAKLRTALGDSADSPRFIETLERRGYRFIADVAPVGVESGPGGDRPAVAAPSHAPRILRVLWDDRALPLAEGHHTIGRDPSCAIWIDSTIISRRHAIITVTPVDAFVEDAGSRNGTFVNGTRIAAPTLINPGDEIRVGPARLVICASAPLESTALEP